LRRILPLTLLLVLAIESYRFFTFLPPPSLISSLPDPFSLSSPSAHHSQLANLILVACHGIYLTGSGVSDHHWALEPFQLNHGTGISLISHVFAGINATLSDPTSLLIFSGGETRPSAGPRTESESYFRLADSRGLLTPELTNRITTEVFALDSYQNLLFSILRFRELVGRYPREVTVVSYEFKRPRFQQLHRRAVGWPEDRFHYIGIDPEFSTAEEKEEVERGEREDARDIWEKDPYGCSEEALGEKRERRNGGRRAWAYDVTSPEAKGLLWWCGGGGGKGEWFTGSLPWDQER
jgi:hypothetical protein